MLNTDERKIHTFLTNNGPVTARELSAGSEVPLDRATAILSVLVSAGDVVQMGSMNTATYALAGYTPPAPPAPVTDNRSEEMRWSDAARAKVLAEEAAKRPKPEPRHVITDADIKLPEPAKPLTEAERRELKLIEGHRGGVNPQAFIR